MPRRRDDEQRRFSRVTPTARQRSLHGLGREDFSSVYKISEAVERRRPGVTQAPSRLALAVFAVICSEFSANRDPLSLPTPSVPRRISGRDEIEQRIRHYRIFAPKRGQRGMFTGIGIMLALRLAMIQIEPVMTRKTINRPKASATTLFV